MVFSDLPQAIVVSGAGSEEVNGVYRATEREYCDAPVYEHAERGQELKITREPHKNAKTGAVKHGWLLGQNSQPIYGARTESLTVPVCLPFIVSILSILRAGESIQVTFIVPSSIGAMGSELHLRKLPAWNGRMTAAARMSRWQRALGLLLQLKSFALQPSIVSQTACIDAYARAGHWQQCHQLFSSVNGSGLQVDLVACTALMDALEKGLQWLLGMHVLSHIWSTGLLPDLVLQNGAISACEKSGMWLFALVVFSAYSVLPDVISHAACISACEKSGRWRSGIGLVLAMRSSGLQPNTISCNSALSACEKGGAWRESFMVHTWADGALASVTSDIISFTALLSAARTSWDKAVGLLSRLQYKKLRLDIGCCNAFALALDTAKQWLQGVLLLKSMWSSVLPNHVTLTSLLSACNKCQQWQTSVHIHALASFMLVATDMVVYEAAVKARSSWEMGQLLLHTARNAGLEPAETRSATVGAGAWWLALQRSSQVDAATGNMALPFLPWQSALKFLHDIRQPDATSYSIATNQCKGLVVRSLSQPSRCCCTWTKCSSSPLTIPSLLGMMPWSKRTFMVPFSTIQPRAQGQAGIDMLKRTNDRLNEGFRSRACLLLTQRGTAHLQLKEPKAALRDAVAAMDLEHSAAEALALEALAELGFKDSSQKILETVGSGHILDPSAPLVLRCVDRWVSEIVSNFSEADLAAATELPMPIHMPSDRYLDGLDEETRAAVIKKYIPDEPFGGTAVISNPTQCLELMKKWEEVFSSMQFQSRRKALWDRRDLSFPQRLMETRTMVAESLANVLEPMGFASGRPGLARCVKQMQAWLQMNDNEMSETRFARLWTLDGQDDEQDNEFVWNPEISNLELQPFHIQSLFGGLDSRTSEMTVAAKDFQAAKALLLAACAATGPPPFVRAEIEASAMRLVTNIFAKHMGKEICGYAASFTEELGSLVLNLHDFDRSLDEQKESFLPTLGVAATKPASTAAAQRKGLASAGLAIGAAGTVASGGSSLLAVGFAAAAAGVGAHAAMVEDPTTPSVGHPFGTSDLELANAVATLKEMLKTGVDLKLFDEISPEERSTAAQMAVEYSKQAHLVSDDETPSVMVPLGSFAEEHCNPLIASMMICAIALIADSIAGGGNINGYSLHSVTVRGSRGCALTYRKAHTCSIL
eukprot:symbB.v1.2.004445.t2/scaffold249.1/size274694/4